MEKLYKKVLTGLIALAVMAATSVAGTKQIILEWNPQNDCDYFYVYVKPSTNGIFTLPLLDRYRTKTNFLDLTPIFLTNYANGEYVTTVSAVREFSYSTNRNASGPIWVTNIFETVSTNQAWIFWQGGPPQAPSGRAFIFPEAP